MPNRHVGVQFLRYGVVGVINTLIDFVILNVAMIVLSHPGGVVLMACNATGFLIANVNSYFGNRYWTFAGHRAASVREFMGFLGIAFGGLLVNSLVLWVLTGGSPASLMHLNLAKIVATIVSMGWNFLGYRLLLTR